MKVIDRTDSAILLEDIACSSVYRLGSREDMADQEVARRIAVWYQQLHNRGFSYVAQNGSDLYDESDDFTLENIATVYKGNIIKINNGLPILRRDTAQTRLRAVFL